MKVIFQSFLQVDWIIIFNIRIHESHIHSHVRTQARIYSHIYLRKYTKPYRSSMWYRISEIATHREKKNVAFGNPLNAQ